MRGNIMKAYSIGLYEKAMPNTLTWKEKLEAAKEAGYDFQLEISIDETDAKLARLDWTKEERLELVKTMYEVGLPIRSMCLSGSRKYPLGSSDPATRPEAWRSWRRLFSWQTTWASASFSWQATTYITTSPHRRP